MSSAVAASILAVLLSTVPWAATAQVYKWVDEKGVVNYGDKPPARGKGAQPLADNGGSVSVVPGIPKEEMEQMRQRDVQRRMQQLEREVDELRARDYARDTVAPYPVSEVYVPAYGYAYDWYPRRRPGVGHPGFRPEQPIANPPNRSRSFRGSPVETMPSAPAARGPAGRG